MQKPAKMTKPSSYPLIVRKHLTFFHYLFTFVSVLYKVLLCRITLLLQLFGIQNYRGSYQSWLEKSSILQGSIRIPSSYVDLSLSFFYGGQDGGGGDFFIQNTFTKCLLCSTLYEFPQKISNNCHQPEALFEKQSCLPWASQMSLGRAVRLYECKGK